MLGSAVITEPIAVPDIFVSELYSIEEIGSGICRITYVTNLISPHDASWEKVISARILIPKDQIAPAMFKAGKLCGLSVFGHVEGLPKNGDGLH